MTSKFADVSVAAPVEVFAVSAAYREDTHPQKVNLSVGGKFLFLPLQKKKKKKKVLGLRCSLIISFVVLGVIIYQARFFSFIN